jgi:hypothetical protein
MRTDPVKGALRRALYEFLGRALEGAAIIGDHFGQVTDRGDGALLVIRPHDDVLVLPDRLIPQLAELLAEHNAEIPQPDLRMRLRAVVHAGEVRSGSRGSCDEPIDIAIRLLGSSSVKKALKEPVSPLVLVVSEKIRASIVGDGYVYTGHRLPCRLHMRDRGSGGRWRVLRPPHRCPLRDLPRPHTSAGCRTALPIPRFSRRGCISGRLRLPGAYRKRDNLITHRRGDGIVRFPSSVHCLLTWTGIGR